MKANQQRMFSHNEIKNPNEIVNPKSFFGSIFGPVIRLFIVLIPIFLIIILALGELYAKLAYENYAYELNDKGVLIKSGVVFKRNVFIPYEKIQNFEIFQGIIARKLGIYQIFIETAGYSVAANSSINSAEGQILGVSQQEAEEIREKILAMQNKNKAE